MSDEQSKIQRRLDRARTKYTVLEDLMEERTRELYSSRQELLSIIFGLNHDLKAPLKTIQGYAQAIEDDLQEASYDEIPAFAQRISGLCVRLEDIIDRLVDLTKIEQAAVASEAIHFPTLLEEVVTTLAEVIDSAAVEVIYDFGHQTDLVVSRTRLFHALLNLVANGVQYRDPSKSPNVVKIVTTDSLEPRTFVVRVEDNGIGIQHSEIGRVFDMFYRGTGAERSGTGLGLYLVRSNVEKMNGRVSLRSGTEGSTFTLTFHV